MARALSILWRLYRKNARVYLWPAGNTTSHVPRLSGMNELLNWIIVFFIIFLIAINHNKKKLFCILFFEKILKNDRDLGKTLNWHASVQLVPENLTFEVNLNLKICHGILRLCSRTTVIWGFVHACFRRTFSELKYHIHQENDIWLSNECRHWAALLF